MKCWLVSSLVLGSLAALNVHAIEMNRRQSLLSGLFTTLLGPKGCETAMAAARANLLDLTGPEISSGLVQCRAREILRKPIFSALTYQGDGNVWMRFEGRVESTGVPYIDQHESLGSLEALFSPELPDILNDWRKTHPNLSDAAFESIQARLAKISEFEDIEKHHAHLNELYGDTASTITQFPWSSFAWAKVFGERLALTEAQLATEFGVDVGQIHGAVEEAFLPRNLQFVGYLLPLHTQSRPTFYSHKFVERLAEKIGAYSPHFAETLLRHNQPGREFERVTANWRSPNRAPQTPEQLQVAFRSQLVRYLALEIEENKPLAIQIRGSWQLINKLIEPREDSGGSNTPALYMVRLAQQYGQAIDFLNRVRETTARVTFNKPNEAIAAIDQLREELQLIIETLPQRIEAERMKRQRYRTLEPIEELKRKVELPGAFSDGWRSVATSNDELDPQAWLGTLRTLGLTIRVVDELLNQSEAVETASPRTPPEECTQPLLGAPIESPLEPAFDHPINETSKIEVREE